jgi:SAM-dependent methyltransferase
VPTRAAASGGTETGPHTTLSTRVEIVQWQLEGRVPTGPARSGALARMRDTRAMSGAQVPPSHYDWSAYNVKGRWASYWHQIDEVVRSGARSCLEIGTGSGIVRDTLRRLGVDVTVVDIDENLAADRVGDVRALPAEPAEFDVVLCSQVLEHPPSRTPPQAVGELHRVCRSRAIVSLPQSGRDLTIELAVPKLIRRRRVHARVNSPKAWRFDGQHYWQVLSRGTGRRAVRRVLAGSGFRIEREYTVPELTYHRFYVLTRASPHRPEPGG